MEKIQERKKGISLIVLVITIIVMIILAAAIIISLNNNGIINNANEAVKVTGLAEIKELASVLWMDAYLDGKTGNELVNAIETGLLDADPEYKSKYDVEITNSGVGISYKAENAGIEAYMLGTNGQGRKVTDETFVTIREDGEYIFVSNDVIKDAETSITYMGINMSSTPYVVVIYKGTKYKINLEGTSIENIRTKSVENIPDNVGLIYNLVNEKKRVTIYDTFSRWELFSEATDGTFILGASGSLTEPKKLVLPISSSNTLEAEIIGNYILIDSSKKIEINIVGTTSYCEHSWQFDTNAHEKHCHMCTKCGVYAQHTNIRTDDLYPDFYIHGEKCTACGFSKGHEYDSCGEGICYCDCGATQDCTHPNAIWTNGYLICDKCDYYEVCNHPNASWDSYGYFTCDKCDFAEYDITRCTHPDANWDEYGYFMCPSCGFSEQNLNKCTHPEGSWDASGYFVCPSCGHEEYDAAYDTTLGE